MMNFLNALFAANWIGVVITALITVVAGFYIRRSAKNEAEKVARTAYEGAIAAMKEHISALQQRVQDMEEENRHLREVTETVFELLKARDIHISVSGHLITIREGKETVVKRIHKEEGSA